MDFPIFPVWLSPLILVIAILLIATYVVVAARAKKEKCFRCNAVNAIDAAICEKCGTNLVVLKLDAAYMLGVLGMLLGLAPFILLMMSARNYPDAPIPELIIAGIGFVVFIAGFVILLKMRAQRLQRKRQAVILGTKFYGGFCVKCGTELLGGSTKCQKCGWKVNTEKPNWAIVSKNGKTGLPQVNLKVTCQKCQAENPPSEIRCQKCHANLLTYESVWQRLAYFIVSILVSLGAGWLASNIFENPELDEGFSALGFGMITLVLIAVVMPIWGLYRALSHGSLTEMLTERAGRHNKAQPWQALEDLGHALELAPIQEHAQIMTTRMNLYQTLGLMQNATREELAITYAKERNPQGGMGLFIAGNMFGDSFSQGYLRGISKQARKDREKMYAEGRAIAVGYCLVCAEAVELTNDFRCPNAEKKGAAKHTGKPKILQYVIPADIEAGKLAVMQAVEVARKQMRSRVINIALIVVGIVALCSGLNFLFNQ